MDGMLKLDESQDMSVFWEKTGQRNPRKGAENRKEHQSEVREGYFKVQQI